MESSKMSKSRGNVVKPRPIANVLGMDALRYFLLREVVFGQDGNFSYDALVQRYNSDLANGLGNLASRTLTMIERNLGGVVPWFESGTILTQLPGTTASFIDENLDEINKLYQKFAFSQALEKIWGLVATWDKYLATEKPWTYSDDQSQRERLARTLFTAAEALRIISILAHPVIPEATRKIWQQLGRPEKLEDQRVDRVGWATSGGSTRIGRLEAVFPRVEKSETIERMEAMEKEASEPAKAPASAAAGTTAGATPAAQPANNKIAIEDFMKVEMRVGQVHTAERVQGADKLLKVNVDIGGEVRQIVAGIAQHYKPEDLVGRKVIVVVNLQPRKLRGVESNGMIVAASVGPEGRPVLAGFLEEVEVGARLK